MEGKISVHFKVKRHLQPHPIHPSDPCTCLYSYKVMEVIFFLEPRPQLVMQLLFFFFHLEFSANYVRQLELIY